LDPEWSHVNYRRAALSCCREAAWVRGRARERPLAVFDERETVRAWRQRLCDKTLFFSLLKVKIDIDPASDGTPVEFAGVTGTSAHRIADRLAQDTEDAIGNALRTAYYARRQCGNFPEAPVDDFDGRWTPESFAVVVGALQELPAIDEGSLAALIECEYITTRGKSVVFDSRFVENVSGSESRTEAKIVRRMTVEAANEKARKLAKRLRMSFFLFSEREQARQIGCSWATWRKTTFYEKAQKIRFRLTRQAGKEKAPASPPVVSLTGDLEAVTGEGDRNETLDRLIAEQEADREPSPLDDDQPDAPPRKVRTRKRL
jgi:hypothetical protein